VAASTQNQALAALPFLYRDVLGRDLEGLDGAVRARRPRSLPVVLSRDEVRAVLSGIEGVQALAARLMYGAGLRLLECLRLRVHDIEPERRQIVVRQGKGQVDRTTVFPLALESALARHLEQASHLYRLDREAGNGGVELPYALARKYPRAPYEWGWFWVFPATKLSTDPRSRILRRHHLHESAIQRAIRGAALRAGIKKRVSPHTLRHYAESRTITG
jgi:integron integrase